MLSLSSYCVFPLLALILRFFWDGPQIFLSTSLSLIWIDVVVQREQRVRLQAQENQLMQSRIAILLSQIQPHFLYNTLTTICGLCDENPKQAKQVTAEFADYLRHNLDALIESASVSFEDELCHTDRKQRGVMAVSLDKIACDYYNWMQGDIVAINAYRGEYMSQYSWGEFTLGGIEMTAMSTMK